MDSRDPSLVPKIVPKRLILLPLGWFQDEGMSVWAHPLDLHYATSTVAGWPRLHFQVWAEDNFGRKELAGYGFCFLPTVVGEYNLECVCWKPAGSKWLDNTRSFFLGGGPQLVHDELVYKQDDRFRLCSETAGVVHVEIGGPAQRL